MDPSWNAAYILRLLFNTSAAVMEGANRIRLVVRLGWNMLLRRRSQMRTGGIVGRQLGGRNFRGLARGGWCRPSSCSEACVLAGCLLPAASLSARMVHNVYA